MVKKNVSVTGRWACLAAAAGLAVAAMPSLGDVGRHRDPVWAPDVFGGYASDEFTVQIKVGQNAPDAAGFGHPVVDGLILQWGGSIRPIFDIPFGNPESARQIGLDRYYKIVVPRGSNTPAMVQALQGTGFFQVVEIAGIGGTADTFPNDPSFAQCYGQHNTGQNTCAGVGTPDADIDCPQAWDIFTGSDEITVAVIDSGVWNHVDLVANLVPGWNTVLNNTNVSDDCDHGTHVAGTVSGVGNNGVGVAGVSWRTKIMPIKVLTGCGGNSTDCAEGIIYATDNGAQIGTMSLQYYDYAQVHRDSCRYAHDNGALMIAANGNGQGRRVAAPAAFPFCMGIAATTNTDSFASFSNYGPECDISAPGQDVYSYSQTNGYRCLSGTSMATPHTSGLASLIWGYAPGLIHDEVEMILKTAVEDKGPPGWDEQFGWGRINAYNAIQIADPGLSLNVLTAQPTLLPPGQDHVFQVRVRPGNDQLVPGSVLLNYRYGTGTYLTAPLTHVTGETWEATLPGANCNTNPQWYVSARGVTGGLKTVPRTAPAQVYSAAVGVIEDYDVFAEQLNSGLPAGWTATGLWSITSACFTASPCGGGTFAYYGQTGQTQCNYATGARSTGSLTTAPIQLPPTPHGGEIKLSFCSAKRTENSPGFDVASVWFNGVQVDTVPDTQNWVTREVNLTAFAGQTGRLEFRFDTVDQGMNAYRGWNVDGIKVHFRAEYCVNPCYPDCDTSTGVGNLDVFDFLCFQNRYDAADPYACDCDTSTGPGVCDVFDFLCFQNAYDAGCP